MPMRHLPIYIILLLLLAACGSGQQSSTPTIRIDVSPTPIPATLTPIPEKTKVWVILGGVLPEQTIRSVVESANSISKTTGLVLEQKPQLNTAELASQAAGLKLIIVMPPDPDVQRISEQYPDIAFVTIGIDGLTARDNLYIMTNAEGHPEWEGFLGGFVSALVTSEWRIGMVTHAGSGDGAKAADGFVNGGVFYCGLCNPLYPPFVDYPYTLALNANATQSEWQPIADDMIHSGVKTVYIYPEVAVPELLVYLAQNGLRIISGEPVIEPLRPAYLATINQTSSTSVTAALQDAIGGKSPGTYTGQVMVTPIDGNLISEGKMRFINQVITDLLNGTIQATSISK